MNRTASNIIAHLLWPGLFLSYILRDTKESDFYIKQCFWLNLAASLIIIIGFIPLEVIQLICVVSNFMLALCWSYSFFGAINGLENNIPFMEFKGKCNEQVLKILSKICNKYFSKKWSSSVSDNNLDKSINDKN